MLNFLVVALLIALVGQGWNVLGGYGGQYSFGHAAFFGTGAYVTAVLQARYGINAWAGLVLGIAGGALVGAVIGALAFRSGLRGSYFALVTLAFAEVLRILASVAPITGAGGHSDQARLCAGGIPVPEPCAVLLDRPCAGGHLARDRPDHRAEPVRRLSRRRARNEDRRARSGSTSSGSSSPP